MRCTTLDGGGRVVPREVRKVSVERYHHLPSYDVK